MLASKHIGGYKIVLSARQWTGIVLYIRIAAWCVWSKVIIAYVKASNLG
jgi:hypothetical protein